MPLRDLRTLQGMSYRQSPAETLSGCRHLRCKAFLVTVLGVILVASFPATYSSAMLIVGVFLILLGSALAFMYYVARDLGKENTAAGPGVNRSWNRIRQQRLQRRRRRNSATRRLANTNPTSEEHDHDGTAPPPAYENSISVEELMRCPEPSDWTFLPSDPPPVYFPPITALDSNHSHTATDDHPETNQSALPIYSISRELSYTLPSYEQALDETNIYGATNENDNDNGTHLSDQDTVVVELDNDHEIGAGQTTIILCETSVSWSDSIQQLTVRSAPSDGDSVDTITHVSI